MNETLILIPFYNEEKRIDRQAITQATVDHPDLHLLLVDDGSDDQTPQILKKLAEENPQIEYFRSENNLGKGKVLRKATMEKADQISAYEYIGYFDGDLSAPLDYYEVLKTELQNSPQAQMIMASRQPTSDNHLRVKAHRRAIGRLVAGQINKIIGHPFYDTQCGAKLFRTNTFIDLMQEPFISSWLFDMEIILRLRDMPDTLLEEVIIEQPIDEWEHKDGSKITTSYFPNMLQEMLKISRKYND